jgi:hypothetical protein
MGFCSFLDIFTESDKIEENMQNDELKETLKEHLKLKLVSERTMKEMPNFLLGKHVEDVTQEKIQLLFDDEPITDVVVSEYVTPGTFHGKAEVVNDDTPV